MEEEEARAYIAWLERGETLRRVLELKKRVEEGCTAVLLLEYCDGFR